MPIAYAGIGSRETPENVLSVMRHLGADLARRGYLLRSGGAAGADQAFEEGCDQVGGAKEVFLPWAGFQGRRVGAGTLVLEPDILPEAQAIAAQFHPRFPFLTRPVRALHTRNVAQVLGPRLDEPVQFILCWTKGGSGAGGTGQAIRIGQGRGIPVVDLGDNETLFKVQTGEWGPWLHSYW